MWAFDEVLKKNCKSKLKFYPHVYVPHNYKHECADTIQLKNTSQK